MGVGMEGGIGNEDGGKEMGGGGGYRGHGRGVGRVVTKTEEGGGGGIEDTVGKCRHGDKTARSGANLRQEEGEGCDARVLCHSLSHIDSRPWTDFLP